MPSDKTSPWSDTPPTAERVLAVFSRIASVMRGDAWGRASAAGLTPTQAELLALLAARPPGVRLGWLAEQLCITSATASDAVAALVAKGWVRKARAAGDGRALALALSRSGRALALRLAAPSGVVAAAAAALPAQAQEQLLFELLNLVVQLQRTEGFPELRTCLSCEHFEAHRHADAKAPHHCHLVGAPLPERLLRVDCADHRSISVVTASAPSPTLRP